jgi:protein SCO1/2
VYRQVYGAAFELPALVEPLKELVFNRPVAQAHFASGLVDRIKLFCTVYDPATGRYHFDYSLFVQIAVGALAILGIGSWLLLEALRSRRRKQAGS